MGLTEQLIATTYEYFKEHYPSTLNRDPQEFRDYIYVVLKKYQRTEILVEDFISMIRESENGFEIE